MKKFNLSLDDFSPHPKAGLNFESIEWCDKLIEKYPDIKINLFVPAAYCRWGEKPYYLSSHLEWVEKVNALPEKNYRINMHGLFHKSAKFRRPPSNNDEFQYLRAGSERVYVEKMIGEFEKAGLKFHKTFRPPGWKISSPAAKYLTESGFIIAGNSVYYDMLKHKVNNMRWVSYNWDMTKPCDIDGDVVAYGHTSSFTNNYMNETGFYLVDELLKNEEYEFRFIEDLV